MASGTGIDARWSDDLVRVRVERRVGWIVLANPPVNILTTAMMRKIADDVLRLDADPGATVIAITAEGERAFSAGADVGEHTDELERDHHDAMFAMIEALRGSGKPRIALVPAACYGGGNELAFACDMVAASRAAKFAIPEVKLGVVNAIGARLMMAHTGPAAALQLALRGETISAAEAYRIGLVVTLFEQATFSNEAEAFVEEIASRSGAALLVGRELLQHSAGMPTSEAIAYLRREVAARAMRTADYAEGMAAFREKRPPIWSNL